jgi:hypothetical protein
MALRRRMKAVLSVLGGIVGVIGFGVLGLFYNRSDDTVGVPMRGETVCLIIDGAKVPAIASPECYVMHDRAAAAVCRATAWGSAYNFVVPYTARGIDSVEIRHNGKAVGDRSLIGMRRGRLTVPATHSSSRTPWGPGVTWVFVEDDGGNVILFNPNPGKTVYFTLPEATHDTP